MARAEAYLHAEFRLDTSNRLATVHERHRQKDRTDRQRTDNIGRTVLQTVAQRLTKINRNISKVTLSNSVCSPVAIVQAWIELAVG